MKLEQAARQALNYLENSHARFYEEREKAITALRETLAEPQITTPDVCGEVCARAKLCYGCNKDLEEANAKYAEQAEQEPVAYIYKESSPETGEFVFAAPVRTKDLTADEIEEFYTRIWSGGKKSMFAFARAVIAADREKNRGTA